MITSTGENPTRSAFGEPLKSGAQLGSRIKYQSFDVLNRAAGFAAARHGRAAPVSGSDAVGGAKSYLVEGIAARVVALRLRVAPDFGAEGRSQAICLMLRTTEDAKSASIAQPYPRLLWGFRCADERGASAASSVRGRTIVMLFRVAIVLFRALTKRGAPARGAALVSPVLTSLIEAAWYALLRHIDLWQSPDANFDRDMARRARAQEVFRRAAQRLSPFQPAIR
jgi:hypothetical protein